ncbi:gliding motility protein GldB [Chryseobacterium lactis]|uniref:Gliding motility protein GldB n=1 Tax=Chryseobacterium lactis TaxID=1241981 RepID=A0A3G6RJW2_CHRLC|nr:gliding motility protein GldB [Chryseobacterium lactis]AZA84873.1 gliding motility protein GldB [Chryseobacterium lactis]AZB05261.1 gliding motility protein GldB [Chryseobacterium lactis]PNW12244.1 gliding motility protein GldB [Chryseobacterium lactis]
MKIFRFIALSSVLVLGLDSCKKEPENQWKVEIKETTEKADVTDISKEFYNPAIPLEQFKAQFPWFQGTVSDEDFGKRRTDAEEIKIYKEAIGKIDQAKLQKELQGLFSHIKYYFPQFKSPKVYLFSSALQMVQDPIIYDSKTNLLFIDITGFMGDGNPHYKGLELYFQKSMNPQNIVPKVSQIFAENIVTESPDHQKFIDQIILNGKVMILQDAFLPDFPDYLKMNYTQKQYDWAKSNEANIWNYFVESNLIFGDDPRLGERFIAPGPFSKFYTEIDNESSPQIGIFTGWQICKAYLKEKPDTKLTAFLKMDATTIFNQSGYKPTVTK